MTDDISALGLKDMPKWGGDVFGSIKILPGGSGLNSTLHAANYARLSTISSSVCLFSSCGDDVWGKMCIDALRHPLITSRISVTSAFSTASCLVLSGPDDRAFVTDKGCLGHMSVSWFNEEELLSCNHLHSAGFFTCDILQTEMRDLFRKAHAVGVSTSLNPQYATEKQWELVRDICPHLTLFIGNEAEAMCITNETTYSSAACVLLQWGVRVVVITRAQNGASAITRDTSSNQIVEYSQAIIPVHVCDATGAGDAFAGAFLVEWVASGNLAECLRAGSVAGACAVSVQGASTMVPDDLVRNIETLIFPPMSTAITVLQSL